MKLDMINQEIFIGDSVVYGKSTRNALTVDTVTEIHENYIRCNLRTVFLFIKVPKCESFCFCDNYSRNNYVDAFGNELKVNDIVGCYRVYHNSKTLVTGTITKLTPRTAEISINNIIIRRRLFNVFKLTDIIQETKKEFPERFI